MTPSPRFVVLVCVLIAGVAELGMAQESTSALPDSPSRSRELPSTPEESQATRDTSSRGLPRDFLRDQKAIWWTFPGQLAKGKHWLPTLTIAGATAGLITADPHVMPYFRSHARNLDELNDAFQSPIAAGEILVVPVSLMAAGYARHDSYQVDTALLAGLAYADSAVVDLGVKAITRRKRPSDVPPGTPFNDTFFNGGATPFKGNSFPSGHATAAFAVATVVATRYHRHRWVPWAAYGFATVVSLSRVSTQSHYPSDVFLGAALGYTIARYQVLPGR